MIILYSYIIIAVVVFLFQLYGIFKEPDYTVARWFSVVFAANVAVFWFPLGLYVLAIYVLDKIGVSRK